MEPLLPLSGVQWVLRGQSPGEQMPLIHFPGGATVKNLPAVQETRVRSLAQEDPVEKEMAAHSSILAWRTPMDRGAWRATIHGVTKSRTWLSTHKFEPPLSGIYVVLSIYSPFGFIFVSNIVL